MYDSNQIFFECINWHLLDPEGVREILKTEGKALHLQNFQKRKKDLSNLYSVENSKI